jgi:uncharacterized protein YjbJ (UPF0337 family)
MEPPPLYKREFNREEPYLTFDSGMSPIKEEVGKVTKDRDLKAKGRAEKKAGKVQQRISRAKEAVAKLKGKLTELKTG